MAAGPTLLTASQLLFLGDGLPSVCYSTWLPDLQLLMGPAIYGGRTIDELPGLKDCVKTLRTAMSPLHTMSTSSALSPSALVYQFQSFHIDPDMVPSCPTPLYTPPSGTTPKLHDPSEASLSDTPDSLIDFTDPLYTPAGHA